MVSLEWPPNPAEDRPQTRTRQRKLSEEEEKFVPVDGRALPSGLDSESAPKEVAGLLSTSPTPGPARPALRSAYIPDPAYRIACVTRVSSSKAECRVRQGGGGQGSEVVCSLRRDSRRGFRPREEQDRKVRSRLKRDRL